MTTPSFGHFSPSGTEYIVTALHTPRPWYNYLWNDHLVALFTHVGQGESFSQDRMGRRVPLVSARMAFLRNRESGDWWSANGLPTDREYDNFECAHGFGYSNVHIEHQGIASDLRVYVPTQGLCEIWCLTVENKGDTNAPLSLFLFADTTIDGTDRHQAYYHTNCSCDQALQSVVIRRRIRYDEHKLAYNFMAFDQRIDGYDTRKRSFIGNGTWQNPDAVVSGSCTNSDSQAEKPVMALQTDLDLAPGQKKTVNVIVGTVFDKADIVKIRAQYFSDNGAERECLVARQIVPSDHGRTEFNTPDASLNMFASHWLKRQVMLGSQWARVRHNGFRDLMQDIGALVFINPAMALEKLKRVLSFQYGNGYAPRTWLNGEMQDRDFSDNHVWIAYTVHNLVMETGDASLLEMEVPFNDGSSASMYEHVRRAVDYLWNDRAMFGLCRIRSGDWNDCLDKVGPQGTGVSVWLSMAWFMANDRFAELASLHGRRVDVDAARDRAKRMRDIVNTNGWDGEYYLRAYTDAGRPVGSRKDRQAPLFVNPQVWSVLSGIGKDGKHLKAMSAVDQHLDKDLGVLSVLNPFSEELADIGIMSRKTPGVQENGGVYLHAGAFKLVADCILKRHDKVEEGIKKMLPFDNSFFEKKDGEPYVFCNCYMAIENSYRYGGCGHSWCTGTAGWFYVALLNYVFGLKPTMQGLRVDPCLPLSWKKCGVKREFRGAMYEVEFALEHDRALTIEVDGQPLDGDLLPWEKGRAFQVKVAGG